MHNRISDRSGARRLFYRAAINKFLGRDSRAAQLCHAALQCADYAKAHNMLAELELPGEDYFRVLARIHAHLQPATYVEIGVDQGRSFDIVRPETLTLGIDPNPRLHKPPGAKQRVYAQTSDDFFAKHDVFAELGGKPVELAFIDGMHQVEYAFRDFINLERYCSRRSIILIHDVFPIDAMSAARERISSFWSGDIWRLILILKKYRPDLIVNTIGAKPTGLGIVQNLDPASHVLSERYQEIVDEFMAVDLASMEGHKKRMLNHFPNDWTAIEGLLDRSRSLPG